MCFLLLTQTQWMIFLHWKFFSLTIRVEMDHMTRECSTSGQTKPVQVWKGLCRHSSTIFGCVQCLTDSKSTPWERWCWHMMMIISSLCSGSPQNCVSKLLVVILRQWWHIRLSKTNVRNDMGKCNRMIRCVFLISKALPTLSWSFRNV